MRHSLTADGHFVQHSFRIDLPFTMFLVVMTLLFLAFGIMLDSGPFVPVDYTVFW